MTSSAILVDCAGRVGWAGRAERARRPGQNAGGRTSLLSLSSLSWSLRDEGGLAALVESRLAAISAFALTLNASFSLAANLPHSAPAALKASTLFIEPFSLVTSCFMKSAYPERPPPFLLALVPSLLIASAAFAAAVLIAATEAARPARESRVTVSAASRQGHQRNHSLFFSGRV